MSFEDGSSEWMNPPPPGTGEDCQLYSKNHSEGRLETRDSRRFSYSPDRTGSRSRSRSNDRYKHRRRRSRSRSREYRRRRSRSRSRSSSHKRHDRKYYRSYRSKYSRSRSRSHSRPRRYRRSYSRSRSPSPHRRRSRSYYSTSSNSDRDNYRRTSRDIHKTRDYTKNVYPKQDEIEEEEETEPVQENTFKNDGSFLEMFKKMQEAQQQSVKTEDAEATSSDAKKPIPIFGKRRGGRILKTGVVQKVKNPNEVEEEPKDAWSVYMKEVRKYKEACCDDDSKTRPLVK